MQFVIGETGAFTAKHQRDRVLHALGNQLLARFTGIQHGPAQGAGTGTGADDQTTVGNGFIQGRHDTGASQDIAGPRCQGDGLLIRLGLGIDQHQLSQPHGLHGRAADPMLPV